MAFQWHLLALNIRFQKINMCFHLASKMILSSFVMHSSLFFDHFLPDFIFCIFPVSCVFLLVSGYFMGFPHTFWDAQSLFHFLYFTFKVLISGSVCVNPSCVKLLDRPENFQSAPREKTTSHP